METNTELLTPDAVATVVPHPVVEYPLHVKLTELDATRKKT